MSIFVRIALSALLMAACGIAAPFAHEGNGHNTPVITSFNLAPRVEATSQRFEIVAVAREETLQIYLDAFDTNEPIDKAAVMVDVLGAEVAAIRAEAGLYYHPAPWVARAGTYPVIFTVKSAGGDDVLAAMLTVAEPISPGDTTTYIAWLSMARGTQFILPFITFIAGAAVMRWWKRRRHLAMLAAGVVGAILALDSARADPQLSTPAQDRSYRTADGIVVVPKATQRILGIRTVRTIATPHRAVLELPGRIVADPNASGLVQSALGGRLSPPPGGFPQLGTSVKAGDVLAYVTPPLQAIDLSDMRQRSGELDQQISIVERRLGRLEKLVPSGAATSAQLDETRLELDGLRARRVAIDRARRDPEPLVAPVDGLIADASAVAGQIASQNAVVYRIVDPTRLWVEALSFGVVSTLGEASAKLNDGRTLTLGYAGAGFADRNQSVPVNFAIVDVVPRLRLGQLVTVLAPSGEAQEGIAIPRASVVRGPNGQDLVYAHTTAERFIAIAVRTAPLDAHNLLVKFGLEADIRVVSQGAELLAQIR